MVPCIFMLEPTGVGGAMEANGEVYYFCSDACRATFRSEHEHTQGESDDYVDGTVCDACGAEIGGNM